MKHLKYKVLIEKSKTGFAAYVPDLPGCVAMGSTKKDAIKLIKEGIEFHIEGLQLNGYEIPRPESEVIDVTVEVA